jgi:hypothetical protein
VSTNGGDARRKRWVRRHPWATALLAVVFVVFALSAVFAEDRTPSERAEVALGLVILYAPLLGVVLLVTWIIDRRARPPDPAASAFQTAVVEHAIPPYALPGEPPAAGASGTEAGPDLDRPPPPAPAEPFRPIDLDDLLAMPATEFAQTCARALQGLGYDRVEATGRAGEFDPAFTAIDPQGRPVAVLCRRNEAGLGIASSLVQGFANSLASHQPTARGAILTNAEFTRSAKDLAARHEIVLIDGDDLVKLLNLLGTV